MVVSWPSFLAAATRSSIASARAVAAMLVTRTAAALPIAVVVSSACRRATAKSNFLILSPLVSLVFPTPVSPASYCARDLSPALVAAILQTHDSQDEIAVGSGAR